MEKFYLKPTVKAEPLIWRWYAWPYLIPPFTAGCNIVGRHLKIMESYVQNPEIHEQAVRNPKLLGGPFIDLDREKIDEVKDLITQTKRDCEKLINFSNALKEFDKAFQAEAQGDSLEEFYVRLPKNLEGFIELVYDINNHPSIRLLEPLIYKTYYSDTHQTIALSEIDSDYRKFVLSTPRPNYENEVYLNVPFSDLRLDELFKMKEKSQDFNQIKLLFDIPATKEKLFQSFFTSIPPSLPTDRNYRDEGIRIRYFGHACMLVQTKYISILFDPVMSYPINANGMLRYTFADLPDYIDYVVITHNHQDHLMFETLLQLRHKVGSIVFPSNNNGSIEDPSIKLILKHMGFTSLIELREMEDVAFQEGRILALPFLGEHSDLNIQSKLSYCVQIKDKKFLFAADSSNLSPPLYEHIHNWLESIDILFLGMECDGAPLTWLYGPLLSNPLKRGYDKNRTLSGSDFNKAWSIVEKLRCKKAYVYAMGQEPWLSYVMALQYTENSPQIIESNKFIHTCRENSIESERLFGRKEWLILH